MTFISLPARDVGGGDGSTDCGSGIGAMGSIILLKAYPLLRQKSAKVTRKVGNNFSANLRNGLSAGVCDGGSGI
jgi:hypothetical protein